MCHFIWHDSVCTECGLSFDRQLTYCQVTTPSTAVPSRRTRSKSPRQKGSTSSSAVPCTRKYTMLSDPVFRCQSCQLGMLEPRVHIPRFAKSKEQETQSEMADNGDEFVYADEDKDADWCPSDGND